MLIACWSPKGGSGTTAVAAALALLLARARPGGALLADLAGDVPAVLGLAEPSGPGLAEWLASGAGPDALARLEVPAGDALSVLPAGEPAPAATGDRAEALAASLTADPRAVVVDCGTLGPAAPPAAVTVAASAALSLAVLRPCYLALRRALAAPVRPSAVVLVREPERSLSRRDVEEVLGVPVRAEIPFDGSVARAVDAGLLATRLPRGLERALRAAA